MTAWQPSIPGLTVEDVGGSHITNAAKATLADLDAKGLLGGEHALTCQLILGLARAVDRGLAFGKVTIATTTMAKELREALASLPVPEEVPAGDAWDQLQREIAQANADAGI